MKRFINASLCLLALLFVSACGKTENPEVVRQIRNTVSEAIRTYRDKYNDSNWINENFYSIYFADINSNKQIESIIKDKGLSFSTWDGLKIYKEAARKDLRYIKEDDSYLVRYDFIVIAILKNDAIEILEKPKTAMQYYHLVKDKKDNKYRISEVYPSTDQIDLIFKDAFIKNYMDFTKNESIKNQVESIK